MKILSPAYVAGLVDGEGCITIRVTPGAQGKKPYYSAALTVGMAVKALPILRMLHSQFQGSLNRTAKATEKHAEMWRWAVEGPAAASVLEKIESLLELKAEQARLAIRVERVIKKSLPQTPQGRCRWTDHARSHCHTVYLRIQELNERGIGREFPKMPAGYTPVAQLVAGKWVTFQQSLCSDTGWESFKETWPVSGTMRSGVLFLPPPPDSPIGESGFSSLPGLLPTPAASYSQNTPENHLRKKPGRSQVTDLRILVEHGLIASGGRLLKTPTAQLGSNGGSQPPDKRRAGGHGPTLADEVEWLPLEPGGIVDWGPYAQAILRQQQVTGRMVPHPLEPGKTRGVLSVSFVEWLMGLPEGHVTDVPGLSRKAVLRILGNGVVTRQALLAISVMWDSYLEATSLA